VLNPLLGELGQALHPLSLSCHDLNEVRQWWWRWRRLLVLRWWFNLDLFVDFPVLITFSLCLPLVLLRGLGSRGCAPTTPHRRCWRGSTSASAATSLATCGDNGFLTSGFLEAGHDPVGLTNRHLSKMKVKKV
jgi:hypothetical protein